MDNGNFPEKIHYTFQTEPNAILRPVHGVWGGVTPHGEIEMSFYDETAMPPNASEQMVGPDGTPGPERAFLDTDNREMLRTIHSRIILNYQTARAIYEWLEERLNEVEAGGGGDMYEPGTGLPQ